VDALLEGVADALGALFELLANLAGYGELTLDFVLHGSFLVELPLEVSHLLLELEPRLLLGRQLFRVNPQLEFELLHLVAIHPR
jgi:hypothetical protein